MPPAPHVARNARTAITFNYLAFTIPHFTGGRRSVRSICTSSCCMRRWMLWRSSCGAPPLCISASSTASITCRWLEKTAEEIPTFPISRRCAETLQIRVGVSHLRMQTQAWRNVGHLRHVPGRCRPLVQAAGGLLHIGHQILLLQATRTPQRCERTQVLCNREAVGQERRRTVREVSSNGVGHELCAVNSHGPGRCGSSSHRASPAQNRSSRLDGRLSVGRYRQIYTAAGRCRRT